MEPQDLITMLKSQHKALVADLALVLENSEDETTARKNDLVSNLENFKKNLLAHVKVEKDVFYPDYLEKKSRRGDDVSKTKEFIQEMDDIIEVVLKFLGQYDSPELIGGSFAEFRKGLLDIVATLKIRIETEEEGIFDFYLMMK